MAMEIRGVIYVDVNSIKVSVWCTIFTIYC
jgi:hypothetical protein